MVRRIGGVTRPVQNTHLGCHQKLHSSSALSQSLNPDDFCKVPGNINLASLVNGNPWLNSCGANDIRTHTMDLPRYFLCVFPSNVCTWPVQNHLQVFGRLKFEKLTLINDYSHTTITYYHYCDTIHLLQLQW